MARTILTGEVRSGKRITQIPVSGASWSIANRGIGDVSASIPLAANDFRVLEKEIIGGRFPSENTWPSPMTFPSEPGSTWHAGQGIRPEFLSAIQPARCFLAVLEGDDVIEAGPIWAWDMREGSTLLDVKAAGIGSIFDHRKVMGVISSGYAAWQVTHSGMSLGTIAKRLVQLSMSHTGGSLPIVLPDDVFGADDEDHQRTYRGHELATVKDRLDQLMGVLGGPDIAFDPRLTVDRLGIEWVMRVGTEADPLLHQAGDDHVWDFRVPRGSVSGLGVSVDATGLASYSWATGAGTDEALLMSRATDSRMVDNGFPLLETSESRSSVEVNSTLNGWATGNLAPASRPWMTWTATVLADSYPRLGTYRPGDFARIWVADDHALLSLLLPNGYHRARIVNVSGDLSGFVKLTFAPLRES